MLVHVQYRADKYNCITDKNCVQLFAKYSTVFALTFCLFSLGTPLCLTHLDKLFTHFLYSSYISLTTVK